MEQTLHVFLVQTLHLRDEYTVLPRIHFISPMLSLNSLADFWRKFKSSTSIYLWNKPKPRIKASTLQRHKS